MPCSSYARRMRSIHSTRAPARRGAAAIAAIALAGLTALVAPSPASAAPASLRQATCNYAPGGTNWVVPPAVHEITVDAQGGWGGVGGEVPGTLFLSGGLPGRAFHVVATISVTPGETRW